MKKVLMVDPPSGWKYGFPKAYSGDKTFPDVQWFIDNGYPQHEIDNGMLKYVRVWEEEDDNSTR